MPAGTLITDFSGTKARVEELWEFMPLKVVIARKRKTGSASGARLRKAFGPITSIFFSQMDGSIPAIARKTIEIIEEEHKRGQEVTIYLSGKDEELYLGLLFAAYARDLLVKRVITSVADKRGLVSLPKFGFGLSKTKRKILEELDRTNSDIPIVKLAKKVGKTRAVVHKHLRDLDNLGLIDKNYYITEAGKVAIL